MTTRMIRLSPERVQELEKLSVGHKRPRRRDISAMLEALAAEGSRGQSLPPGEFVPFGEAVAHVLWPWFCHVDALRFAAECCEQHNAHLECAVALAVLDHRNVTRNGRTVTITLPESYA